MKLRCLALIAFLFCTLFAFAGDTNSSKVDQIQHHGPFKVGTCLEVMSRYLKLTDEQQVKVRPLCEGRDKEALREHEHPVTPQKAVELNDNFYRHMRPLLNADQQKKLDTMQQNYHVVHGLATASLKPNSPVEIMSQMLDLTTEQQAKVKPYLKDQTKQIQVLERDRKLTPEDKTAKLRQIYENTFAQIHPLLNADQQSVLDRGGQDKIIEALEGQHERKLAQEGKSTKESQGDLWVASKLYLLNRNLSLTDDQRTKVEAILRKESLKLPSSSVAGSAYERTSRADESLRPVLVPSTRPGHYASELAPMPTMPSSSSGIVLVPEQAAWNDALKQIRPLLSKDQQWDLEHSFAGSKSGGPVSPIDVQHPGQSRGDAIEVLARQLGLSDDQKTKIQPLLADKSRKLKALKSDSSLSQDDKKAKAKEIRENSLAQIRPLLTPDQQAKLDQSPKGHDNGENKQSTSESAQ